MMASMASAHADEELYEPVWRRVNRFLGKPISFDLNDLESEAEWELETYEWSEEDSEEV